MKLTLHTFLSVDGVMQGPGAAEEDRSGGFDRGGWLVPYADQDLDEIVTGWFAKVDAILLGRTTYDVFAAFWPQVTDPADAVAVALNDKPKYVVSTTLRDPSWAGTSVLVGDALARVRRLKEQPGGELQVHGSCLLARTLHEAGLVDEYRLITFPVCVGTGKRLFTDGAPANGFTLVDSKVTGSGAIYTALTPTPFRTGDFTVEDGQEKIA